MDCFKALNSHFSKWLGKEELLNSSEKGVIFTDAPETSVVASNGRYDLCIFGQAYKTVVCYNEKIAPYFNELRDYICASTSFEAEFAALRCRFGRAITYKYNYAIYKIPEIAANGELISRKITADDYDAWREFVIAKGCKGNDSQREDAFKQLVKRGVACGVFVDNKLVSCTDTLVEGNVCRILAYTLPAYRLNGYALDSVANTVKNAFKSGLAPYLSFPIGCTAGIKLADKLGFIFYADAIALDLN